MESGFRKAHAPLCFIVGWTGSSVSPGHSWGLDGLGGFVPLSGVGAQRVWALPGWAPRGKALSDFFPLPCPLSLTR